jgi:adenylate kinase
VIIVVGHYSEIVDDDILEKLFVIRLNPLELLERLRRRGWPPAKVLDNVEAELMGVCTANALAEHPRSKVCEIDASGRRPEDVSKEVIEVLQGVRECRVFVDWLERGDVVRSLLSSGVLSLQG